MRGVPLNREQRRGLIAESLKADPGLSNREHARRTGADHKTVQAVREQEVAGGEIPHLDTRTAPDGKSYPASQAADRPRASALPQQDLDALNNAPRVLTVVLNGLTAPLRAALVGIPVWSHFAPSVRSPLPSVSSAGERGASAQGTLT